MPAPITHGCPLQHRVSGRASARVRIGVSAALLALLFVWVLPTPSVGAAGRPGGAAARGFALEPLNARLRKLVVQRARGLLTRGEMVLLSSGPSGRLGKLSIVRRVRAPLATVYQVLAGVEQYPSYVPNLKSVKIVKRKGNTLLARWNIKVAIVGVSGTDRYVFYPPNRVEVRVVSGNVRHAGWSWWLLPDGPKATVVFGGFYADLRPSSWLVRWIVKRVPSFEHGINIATALSMMRAIARRSEKLAGHKVRSRTGKPRPPAASALGGPVARQLAALGPLLSRGYLGIAISNSDGSFRQACVATTVNAPRKGFYAVIKGVNRWPRFVHGMSYARITRRKKDRQEYRLKLKLMPMNTFKGKLEMRFVSPGRVVVRGLKGKARSLKYSWDLIQRGPKRTVAALCQGSSLKHVSWIMKRIFKANKEMDHASNLAWSIISAVSYKKEAEKRKGRK